jgi:NADPH:quinone reductase-like Zn-dependent oxidoreductase
MGLDAVLDTDAPDFFESVMAITGGEGVRIAIDNIASSTMWPKVMTVLAPGGTVVSSGALAAEIVPLDLRSLYTKSQSVIGIRTATHSGIRGFWELAKHGIHPLIDRTFPFARIADAHSYVEAQSNLGRVLVTM